MKTTRTVGFVLRKDARRKAGGDLIQAAAYSRILTQHGWTVLESCGEFPRGRPLDVLMVFNLDRPIDNVAAIEEAKRQGVPVVLIPIHHPRCHMDEYQRSHAAPRERFFRRLLGSFHRWEVAKDVVRVATGSAPLRGLIRELVRGQLQVQRWMVGSADGFVFIADGEKAMIGEEVCPPAGPSIIVQNGFVAAQGDAPFERPDWDRFVLDHPRFALVVARIEPRKNQTGVLAALKGTGIPVCFVGAENQAHRDYCARFHEELHARPECIHLGPVPPGQIGSVYQKAWVHVSASWFEVSPLVDIEARACGCNVVATSRSYVLDYARDFVRTCDPGDPESVREAVSGAMNDPRSGPPGEEFLRRFSWEASGPGLHEFLTRMAEGR